VFAGPGEGGMQSRLEELARQLCVEARVVFTGPVYGEEKWAAYQDADLFVLPSQNENFGNTAAEAAVVGTPVIVTEQCGIASLLGDGGIVIPHDEATLKREIEQLLEDEAKRRGLAARGAAAALKLGWDTPVAEMETLYGELAQN
jgi:glycosyltransferase involved in cell wall biosynthesis